MKYTARIGSHPEGLIVSEVDSDYQLGMENIHEQIFRSVLDTREEQVRQALINLGWTPPRPAPLKGAKCIVKGCNNYHGQGMFAGELCMPCYTMLTTRDGRTTPRSSVTCIRKHVNSNHSNRNYVNLPRSNL